MDVIFLTLIKCCKYIEIWMIWFYDKEAGFKQTHMECQTNEDPDQRNLESALYEIVFNTFCRN